MAVDQERRRELDRLRQRRKRARDRDRRTENNAVVIKEFDIYTGTAEALQRVKDASGFEDTHELLTILIHGADSLLKRDMSRFEELTKIPNE